MSQRCVFFLRNSNAHIYVLSLNNSKISDFIDLIYPCEFEIKYTTEFKASAIYVDCYHCTDNGKLVTRLYDKRDEFNFPIVNFHF